MVEKESDLLENLTDDQQKELLRKNWQYHDAKWQMAIFQHFGIEKGNQLNQEVVREMGRVEMYRIAKTLGITSVTNIADLRLLCASAMNLYYSPPEFEYHFEPHSGKEMVGVITRCGTNENVKRAGVTNLYECGCFAMRSGWYAALGVEVEEIPEKCLKQGDAACEIRLQVKSWGYGGERSKN